jgi:dihydrofolate reductase
MTSSSLGSCNETEEVKPGTFTCSCTTSSPSVIHSGQLAHTIYPDGAESLTHLTQVLANNVFYINLPTAPPMRPLALVVALTENGGIGSRNKLPWHPVSLSADMFWFRKLTQSRFSVDEDRIRLIPSTENIVLMGRKTWDSIPPRFRPLPGRTNVVMSRSKKTADVEGIVFISSLEDLVCLCSSNAASSTVFVAGGHDIYNLAIESGHAKFIFVTQVLSERLFDCDTLFPSIDWRLYTRVDITREVSELMHPGIRDSCYKEDLDAFLEHNVRFKMFLYIKSNDM